LHDDVDRVPAEGGETAARIRRHDRLNARGELGGLLPVVQRIESYAAFRKGRVELDEGIAAAGILAGAHDVALEPLRILRIDDDHDVAAVHRLRHQHRQQDPLARLRRANNDRAALEVLQGSIERALVAFDAVDIGQPDFAFRLCRRAHSEKAPGPAWQEEAAEGNARGFVQALRVHGVPFEAKAQEELFRRAAVALEPARAHRLHRPAAERGTKAEQTPRLARANQREHQAG